MGSGEGLDHKGVFYTTLTCLSTRVCFHSSNSWPPGHMKTILHVMPRLPFKVVRCMTNKNFIKQHNWIYKRKYVLNISCELCVFCNLHVHASKNTSLEVIVLITVFLFDKVGNLLKWLRKLCIQDIYPCRESYGMTWFYINTNSSVLTEMSMMLSLSKKMSMML